MGHLNFFPVLFKLIKLSRYPISVISIIFLYHSFFEYHRDNEMDLDFYVYIFQFSCYVNCRYEELGPRKMKSPSPRGVDHLSPHPTPGSPQGKSPRRPSRVRRISWRRNILDRVATPVQRQDSVSIPGKQD